MILFCASEQLCEPLHAFWSSNAGSSLLPSDLCLNNVDDAQKSRSVDRRKELKLQLKSIQQQLADDQRNRTAQQKAEEQKVLVLGCASC